MKKKERRANRKMSAKLEIVSLESVKNWDGKPNGFNQQKKKKEKAKQLLFVINSKYVSKQKMLNFF